MSFGHGGFAHLRVPYWNGRRGALRLVVLLFPVLRPSAHRERRLQLHSVHGDCGARVLRLLRLSVQHVLRTLFTLRDTDRLHGSRRGMRSLQRLVDAIHKAGLFVVMDVIQR